MKIVLENGNLTPIPIKFELLGELDNNNCYLKTNQLYSLQGENCEGFSMPTRVYSCKGFIDDIGGMKIDSVVMKQVEGDTDTIFSLTKLDCKLLGIPFEEKLQLFPKDFNWQRVVTTQEQRDFDVNNLGTYKPSPKDGTIRMMHIFVKNIEWGRGTNIIMPNRSKSIDVTTLMRTVKFSFKDINLARRYPIVAKPLFLDNPIFYDKRKKGVNFMLHFAVAGGKGIEPELLEGKNIDDIIKMTWEEPTTNILRDRETWILSDAELEEKRRKLNAMMQNQQEFNRFNFNRLTFID